MIVDDESVIVDELLEFFADENISAISAGDAASAMRIFTESPVGAITVILTDVKMPGQDGLSFAQNMLAIVPEAQAVEIIVMTGHGSFGMAVDALRSRVFDFLRKPVKLTELSQSVGRAHASAVRRRAHVRAEGERMARLREMTLALSDRAEQLTAHVKGAVDFKDSDVLRVISDELRNPLVPVAGLSELIEENAASLSTAQLVEYAGMIRQAGWQLSNLVDALVIASAYASGETATAKPSERASDIVAALVMGHGADARRRGLSLESSSQPNVTVMADRGCLMLALDQLVGNAVRLGKVGQVVRIGAQAVGDEIRFDVISHAAASPEEQPSTASALSDNTLGAGMTGSELGLKLADRLAMVLGGRLETRGHATREFAASVILPMGPVIAVR